MGQVDRRTPHGPDAQIIDERGGAYAAPVMDLADDSGPSTIDIFGSKAGRHPGLARFAAKTAGVRTNPVLALHRLRTARRAAVPGRRVTIRR